MLKYIHLNPVNAKLVIDPEKYPWSSHRHYLGYEKLEWLTTDWILNYFDHDCFVARNRYRKFILTDMQKYETDPLSDIKEKIIVNLNHSIKYQKHDDAIQQTTPIFSLDQITYITSEYYKVDPVDLQKPSRNRTLAKTRSMITYLAIDLNVCPLGKLASYFKRDSSGLSRSIKYLKNDTKIRKELEEIINNLNKSISRV